MEDSSPSGPSGLVEREMDEGEKQGIPLLIRDLLNNHWGILVDGFDDWGTIVERYGDVVSGDKSSSSKAQFRLEARLRLLQAVGSCPTLRRISFNLQQFPSSAREAEALLSPLMSNPALEEVCIEGKLWDESTSMIGGLCDLIRCAPKLRMLNLDVGWRIENDVKGLANALVECSPSLERLTMKAWQSYGIWDILLSVFKGADSNQSISFLCVQQLHMDVDDLSRIVSSNQSLRGISMNVDYDWTKRHWRKLGSSVVTNFTLRHFEIVFWQGLPVTQFESLRGLLDAADKRPSPVIQITISGSGGLSLATKSTCLFLLNVLRELNSVKALRLDFYEVRQSYRLELHRIFDILKMVPQCTLQMLELESCKGKDIEGGWNGLLDALRYNTSLTHLGLKYSQDLDDESFKDLMSLLEVNFTLRTIDYRCTRWEEEGKGPLIDGVLKRNAQRELYIAVLKEAKLKFQKTRAGRLFLCGSPYAGKTRLRRTMMKLCNRSWFGNKLDKLAICNTVQRDVELWGTTGIEVELLQDDEDMQIAVWDLAGQEIFRSLHDIIFPRTDQPYIFLFVFSPYDELTKSTKANLEALLREELEDWLRFVASNSRMGQNLPRMMVTLTHVDKVEDEAIDWVIMILKELQGEFQGVVDLFIDPEIGVLYVNSHKEKHVSSLLKQVFSSFKDLFSKKSDMVPQLCSELTSILARPDPSIYGDPIWSLDQFYTFCFKSVEALKLPEGRNQPSAEVWQSVALYLHDSGTIVLIPESDLVIVYPNWLTHTFLGELINLRHDSQVQRKIRLASQQGVSTETGYVSEKVLEDWLVQFGISKPGDSHNKAETIVTLKLILAKLDLCYRLDDATDARYFFPTIISDCEGQLVRPSAWKSGSDVQPIFFGFRLQCQDPRRTALTSSFFTRLQITLRNKVIANSSLNANVTCSQGYSTFYMDGHEIIMEESPQTKMVGSYVDLLVKGSSRKTKADAVKFVMKHIIEEIRAFCASPRGCQGVTLVLGILRTKCVEMLLPCELRDEKQVVMVERLKQQLQQNVEARLEEENYKDMRSLLIYEHVWTEAVDDDLSRQSEFAKDLLWESEMESILREVKGKRKERLQLLREVSEQLRYEVGESTSQSLSNVELRASSSFGASNPHSTSMSPVVSGHSSEKQLDQLNRVVLDKPEEMDSKLVSIEKGAQSIERRLYQIISIQRSMKSTLTTFHSNLDEIIGFSRSLEPGIIPKRPYFNRKDTRLLQELTATVRIGKAIRLYFMCESKTKPHIIVDQEGMELILDKESCKWLRRLSSFSIQTFWFLLKAGLQVTVGLGQVVPTIDNFETQVSALIGKTAVEKFKVADDTSLTQKKEAWSCLRNVLESKLKGGNRYACLFNLHKVKYVGLEDGDYAWLCDQCMDNGYENSLLEPILSSY